MKTVFVEVSYRDRKFQGLGVCYEKKEDAVERLRQIAKVAKNATITYYSDEHLFIQYKLDGVKYDTSFEKLDVQ